ncbi:MAG TPA: hypothetical protein VFM18_18945 [Methanosarcina sp.]|nr:hypothetical protein [Methanosarcina sp.]
MNNSSVCPIGFIRTWNDPNEDYEKSRCECMTGVICAAGLFNERCPCPAPNEDFNQQGESNA